MDDLGKLLESFFATIVQFFQQLFGIGGGGSHDAGQRTGAQGSGPATPPPQPKDKSVTVSVDQPRLESALRMFIRSQSPDMPETKLNTSVAASLKITNNVIETYWNLLPPPGSPKENYKQLAGLIAKKLLNDPDIGEEIRAAAKKKAGWKSMFVTDEIILNGYEENKGLIESISEQLAANASAITIKKSTAAVPNLPSNGHFVGAAPFTPPGSKPAIQIN